MVGPTKLEPGGPGRGREAADEGGERAGLGAQLQTMAGVVEHGFDLAAMADDTGIAEEAGHVLGAEAA